MAPELPVPMVQYPPASERPDDYPADLPFVPELGCLVTSLSVPAGGSVQSCMWTVEHEEAGKAAGERIRPAPETTAEFVGRITETIVAEFVADGWEVVGDDPGPFPPGSRMMEMRRAGRTRTLSAVAAGPGGHLMLADLPARDE